jgi:GNAT superfamily N-acetyltransferase
MIVPLTAERWSDLEALFGARGACAGCWCMYWRQTTPQWKTRTSERNRAQLHALVQRGEATGLLACDGDLPVGWVQVGPHAAFARLVASTTKRPLVDGGWVINCFFVRREYRGRGLMTQLIDAAVEHARSHGATRVDAFPTASNARTAATFVYVGTASAFERCGFTPHTAQYGKRTATRWVYTLENA